MNQAIEKRPVMALVKWEKPIYWAFETEDSKKRRAYERARYEYTLNYTYQRMMDMYKQQMEMDYRRWSNRIRDQAYRDLYATFGSSRYYGGWDPAYPPGGITVNWQPVEEEVDSWWSGIFDFLKGIF